MMRSLVLLLCLFVFQAFADPYTITKFSGEDVGSPDDFIAAEFGGTLKVSSSGSVQSVQNGRLSVRQKFEDPFGEEETTYQLYEGRKGTSLSNLKAFAPPAGMSYEKLGKAKVFTSKTADADMDVEKVYFDGQAIYAEGASSLFVNYNSQMVELKPAGPAAPAPVAVPVSTPAVAMPVSTPAVPSPVAEPVDDYGSDDDSAIDASENATTDDDEDTIAAPKPVVAPALAIDDDEEECTDDDEDCEEYDVEGDVAATNKAADESDYSADDAANDVTNRFGIADEVRKWSAWGLVAVAAGGAVVGVMQHMEYSDAKDAYDKTGDMIDEHKKSIHDACTSKDGVVDTKCETSMIWFYSQPEQTLYNLEQKKATNKQTMNSYALYRNIWFGVTAVSLTGAIVLFTW
ncbi:MAG: hypothetical protein AUK31_06650 [Fibrobacteres bacterium CG2_30_45_31]|nr:MAG: hypothetical protein AUK31_06650 [Fibrobacteres bacterium CG2_30_45_31]